MEGGLEELVGGREEVTDEKVNLTDILEKMSGGLGERRIFWLLLALKWLPKLFFAYTPSIYSISYPVYSGSFVNSMLSSVSFSCPP